ncbi:MAG: LptF/LptG family permease [Isosphaeraceae bacterium]
MTFGILQRYEMWEVARAFLLALLTMTIIFVLFMVMAEAARIGLSPQDVAILIPYVVPGTLPYTVPVSLLFAVTLVYGRLAGDNEIIAVKTAGLSAWTVIWPVVIVGMALSVALLELSNDAIPRANHQAKLAIFKNFEEMFYKLLKKEREFKPPGWPFLIKVRDVEGKTMIEATIKHRAKGESPNSFDMVVSAERAVINFDTDKGVARVYLDGAELVSDGKDVAIINDSVLEIPIPDRSNNGFEKRIQEWTTVELGREQFKYRKLMADERARQAMAASLWMASGRFQRIDWSGVQNSSVNYNYWKRKLDEYETEKHLRRAQSFGSLMFVLLGAPVGILFARRDFLSAFISCFVPIILLYYPLMMLGVNMGKEGIFDPTYALWGGNVLLGVLAGFVLPPVLKH